MKKILIFLLLFLCISCSSNSLTKKSTKLIDCPFVLFASEHRNYIDSEEIPITLDNLSYKAEINNYAFNKSCFQQDNSSFFSLDILLVINPIKSTSTNVILPLYVALLDTDEQLIEMQYFSVSGKIKKDLNSNIYLETELPKSVMSKLQSYIEVAKKNPKSNNEHLAGNISKSLVLEDKDDWFFETILYILIDYRIV